MDEKFRKRIKSWQAYNDPQAGAEVLIELVRYGTLTPHQIQVAAFLNHPAAKLAANGVKPTGIVINSQLARNTEITDIITSLSILGHEAVARINFGLCRLSLNQYSSTYPYYPSFRRGREKVKLFNTCYYDMWGLESRQIGNGRPIGATFDLLETYIKNPTRINRAALNITQPYTGWSNFCYLPEYVLAFTWDAAQKKSPRPKVLKYCNGFFSDSLILDYIRREVLPWALGDVYNGPKPESININFPLSPLRRKNAVSK